MKLIQRTAMVAGLVMGLATIAAPAQAVPVKNLVPEQSILLQVPGLADLEVPDWIANIIARPPAPPKSPSEPHTEYATCSQVRTWLHRPITEDDPGYTRKLDPDGDGVGCEHGYMHERDDD